MDNIIIKTKQPLQELIPQRQFSFPRSAPEIHAGMFDKWGLAEQLFQGGAFFFREPLIFEPERLAEYLRELLHPVPRRLHSLLDFPPSLWPGRELRKYHCLEVPEGCLFTFQGPQASGLSAPLGGGPCCDSMIP